MPPRLPAPSVLAATAVLCLLLTLAGALTLALGQSLTPGVWTGLSVGVATSALAFVVVAAAIGAMSRATTPHDPPPIATALQEPAPVEPSTAPERHALRDRAVRSTALALHEGLCAAYDHAMISTEQRAPSTRPAPLPGRIADLIELVEDLDTLLAPPRHSVAPIVDPARAALTAHALGSVMWPALRLADDLPPTVRGAEKPLEAAVHHALFNASWRDEVLLRAARYGAIPYLQISAESAPSPLLLAVASRLAASLEPRAMVGTYAAGSVWWGALDAASGPWHIATPRGRVRLVGGRPARRARLGRLMARWGLEVVHSSDALVDLVVIDAGIFTAGPAPSSATPQLWIEPQIATPPLPRPANLAPLERMAS